MKTGIMRKTWSVEEKCRAVLAVWMERKKSYEIWLEMGVKGSLLNQWQDLAMEGMLDALEPQRMKGISTNAVLGCKVRKLLDRKARLRESGSVLKLQKKMLKLQEKNETPG